MKNTWNVPTVEELTVSNTQYGSDHVTDYDYVYQNAEGNWEGTFKAS